MIRPSIRRLVPLLRAIALALGMSAALSGCGIIGHNLQRLGGAIPDLGQLLRIENDSGNSQPVRIEAAQWEEFQSGVYPYRNGERAE